MKEPHLTISPTGVICFSDKVKEKVGLLSKLRREERERQKKAREELAELAKLAKEILIQEQKEKQVKEKLKKQAEKEAKLVSQHINYQINLVGDNKLIVNILVCPIADKYY